VVAFHALATLGSMKPLADMGLAVRLLASLYGLGFYLWKTALPLGLSPLYEFSTIARAGWTPFLAGAALTVALTAIAIGRRRQWPALAAVWVVYVATLVPVLGLFQNGPQIVADRYSYLACLGWALLAGAGVARAAAAAAARPRPTPLAGGVLGATTIAIVALVALTSRQTLVWKDSLTLWTHAVAADPSSARAHAGLGITHLAAGQPEAALEHYRLAVRLDPALPEGLMGLALAMSLTGQAGDAVPLAERAAGRSPDSALFRHHLGEILRRAGRREEALVAFDAAARLDPAAASSRYAIAVTLAELGRREAATAALEEARRVARAADPRDPEGERFTALVYAPFDAERAIRAWERYLEVLARVADPEPGDLARMSQALAALEALRRGPAAASPR
jgi:tetratricopeptide (TPR) repeat protein